MAVPGHAPERCHGARDGFLRYFHEVWDQSLPVAVKPCPIDAGAELTLTDADTLDRAMALARRVRELNPEAPFVVACEEGLSEIRIERSVRHLVKSWAVILFTDPESDRELRCWGGSAGLEIPETLFKSLDQGGVAGVLTTRRGAGMVQAVTRGAETRRTTTAQAVFFALSSLLYGRLSV